ncbi:MAG: dTDP-4-dehydrorhamnose reductase [Pseudomonadota bacterium]
MKIAVFGKNGQVATELARRVPGGMEIRSIGRDEVDFAKPDQVHKAAETLEAEAIINAAAYTAVDQAEDEEELANLINGTSVSTLAAVAAQRNIPFVHLSTDYVFDGSGQGPRRPDGLTRPLGAYGRSKLLGEKGITAAKGPHVILRTAWVFSAHGSNFVKTMLRLGREREVLTVVSDQVGGPTPAGAIADACFKLTLALRDGAAGGLYHFAGAPDVSWADFANEIMDQAGLRTSIVPIPSMKFQTKAVRPMNSRLDCSATERDFGITRPDWKSDLKGILEELKVI